MKKFLSLFLLFIFSWSIVFAQDNASFFAEIFDASTPEKVETTKKTSREEFLNLYWKTCEVATDGCNTIQIWDWVPWASTMMYCEDIYWTKWQENWSCIKEVGKLSKNDESFYNHLKLKTPKNYQNQVKVFVSQFKYKTRNYTDVKKNQFKQKVISKLDNAIFKLTNAYPQDKALPKKVNDVYMMLSLLKLELMKL